MHPIPRHYQIEKVILFLAIIGLLQVLVKEQIQKLTLETVHQQIFRSKTPTYGQALIIMLKRYGSQSH